MNEIQRDADQPPKPSPASAVPAKPLRKHHVRRITASVMLVVLFAGGFFFSVFPVGRAYLRAVLLLPTLVSASEPAPLGYLDVAMHRSHMTVEAENGPVYVDVYAPTVSPPLVPGVRGGVIMIPGIGDNRNVPQLVNLASAFAHSGIVVMVMTTPTLARYSMTAQDSEGVVQVFETLSHWPGVSAQRIGLVGFSGGGPLMCFAAADPRIRDQVAYIALFGSYYDATSLLAAVGRHAITVNGHTQPWQPNPFPIEVLANVISQTLPPAEGLRVRKAFNPGGKLLTPAELSRFSPESQAAYHLLAGDEPGRVDANLAALPPAAHMLLDQLSAGRVLTGIRAPIYLLHDRSDTSVPFTESRDFAAALARIHHPYDLAEFGIFEHVEVRADLGLSQLLGDTPRLLHTLSEVLLIGS